MSEEAVPSETTSKSRLFWLALPLVVFGALVAVFFVQLTSGRDVSELPSALVSKPAPTFSLPPLEGLNRAGAPVPGLSSQDLTGSVKLVNIFASWCAPCRAEHPILMALAEQDGLPIVGINYKDRDENARRFLGTLGNPYTHVGVDAQGRTAIDWGFYGIPESFLVDAEGRVRHKIVGPITADKLQVLRAQIAKLQ
ncbi:MAG: DsbE family thiol:disulfide interchange protein [Pseudomonadota bacterium]